MKAPLAGGLQGVEENLQVTAISDLMDKMWKYLEIINWQPSRDDWHPGGFETGQQND